jgi:hypothetical protein
MTPETPTARMPAEGVVAALACFVFLVISIAAIGGALAANLAGAQTPHSHAGGAVGPFRVAQDVRTSFGFVAVEHAETLEGLTPKELGGATHGIGSFVARDHALVQASITLTNTTQRPLRYTPRQFRLVATGRNGEAKRIALAHATVREGVLQPDAAVDARISFVAPRNGSRLAIEFADPGAPEPLTILLGNGTGKLTAAERRALAQGHELQPHDGHDHTD